jgi:hypothetical protein
MNDIVERIRKLRFVHIPGTSDLMEEACQEIERLRQFDRLQPIEPADAEPLYRSPTLTNEEREAIYRAEARLRTAYVPDDETAATLRSLLARLA